MRCSLAQSEYLMKSASPLRLCFASVFPVLRLRAVFGAALRLVWFGAALGLMLAWLTLPGCAEAAGSASRPFHIYMLLYRGCEEACKGFQDYFQHQHIPVRFTLRDAAQDKSRLPEMVAEAKRLKPDLVVTWGTNATLEAVGKLGQTDPARHITDLPVVFMIVSDPVAAGIVGNLQQPERNVTGTLYLLDARTQLKVARSYLDFRRIGFLFNPSEPNSEYNRRELAGLSREFGFTLLINTVPVINGKPDADSLPRRVAELAQQKTDLLYIGPDSFLNSQRDAITSAALDHGLPVFAAAENPVLKSGALLGVVNKYEGVGRFTARQAARILLEGARPQDIPIQLPRHFSFLVNMDAAQRLKRYPPLKVLDAAELVGRAGYTPSLTKPLEKR